MEKAYKYFDSNIEIISEALQSICKKDMDSLIDSCESAILRGNKIIATGLGKNVPICEKFEGTMLSLGLDARFMHTNTAVHGDLGMVKSGDVIIVLTKSGATCESVYLVELLKQRGILDAWLLSFEEKSVLADSMDNKIIVKMRHEGDLWNIVPNNSTTINLLILQTLAIELSKRLGLQLNTDFKPNHPGGAIGQKLKI